MPEDKIKVSARIPQSLYDKCLTLYDNITTAINAGLVLACQTEEDNSPTSGDNSPTLYDNTEVKELKARVEETERQIKSLKSELNNLRSILQPSINLKAESPVKKSEEKPTTDSENKGKLKMNCEKCGSEFFAERKSKKYCSDACRQAAFKEKK